ncbi:MAG: signal peptidase II [Anaerolineales bacterium]|nr:signal peptidase II [Anaerolineales bacterium]
MKKLHKIGLSLLIFIFCTGFDQITKDLAQTMLKTSPPISMLNNMVLLQYSENPGATLSLGASLPVEVRTVIFVILVGIVLTAIFVYTLKDQHLNVGQFVGLLMTVSGGVGNLLDRILNHGAAIDFINLGIGSLRTGIFNLADVFIVAGAGIFLYASLKKEKITEAEVSGQENL